MTKGFATITPTRGDRPQLLEFCKHQLSRMTVKPEHSYFIDWPAEPSVVDICHRLYQGVRKAQLDGFSEVYVIEDDDFYPSDYFEHMRLGKFDVVGQDFTWYYNLRNNTFKQFHHPGRSSLFITGMSVEWAMNRFKWPVINERFVDIKLWQQATNKGFVETGTIGIKHAIGLCGGKGHYMTMPNSDKDWHWLKSRVDNEAFIFYKSILQ